jgi:hypothetical protein
MSYGVFQPRPVRDWRTAVPNYDLGHGTESRPFTALTLDEQARVVAHFAVLSLSPERPKTPASRKKMGKHARYRTRAL